MAGHCSPGSSQPVMGIPIPRPGDEFDHDYRSEAPELAAVNNHRYGSASPSYGSPAGSSRQGGSPAGYGSPKTTVQVTRQEIAGWMSAFGKTESEVVAAIKVARGDRAVVISILEGTRRPAERSPNPAASPTPAHTPQAQPRRHVIQISRQEIEALSEMFGVKFDRVVEIMRIVRGERDGALKMLSAEATVRQSSQPQWPTFSPPTRSFADDAEVKSLAEILGTTNYGRVAQLLRECNGDKNVALDRLLAEGVEETPQPLVKGMPASSGGEGIAMEDIDLLPEFDERSPRAQGDTDDFFVDGGEPEAMTEAQRRELAQRGALPRAPRGETSGDGSTIGPRENRMLPPQPVNQQMLDEL